MLVSDTEKFIFFHVPKSGGTSVHGFFKEKYGWQDDPPPVLHHMKAKDYMKFHPEKTSYFKFAFVRNPFDRLLSAYSDFVQNRLVGRIQSNYTRFLLNNNQWDDECLCIYRLYETNSDKFSTYGEFYEYYMQAYKWNVDSTDEYYFNLLASSDGGDFLSIGKNQTFEDFCYNFVQSGWCRDIHFLPQSEILCDGDELIPDFIGKTETLSSDIQKISDRLGYNISVGHHRRSNHSNYKEVYNPKMVKIVEEFFAKDFELFGY